MNKTQETWHELALEYYESTVQEMLKSGANENFIRQSVSVPMVKLLIKKTGCRLDYFDELEIEPTDDD